MKISCAVVLAIALAAGAAAAQENKPVPKDSVRVHLPGCTKGYIFTVAPRTIENPGSVDVPAGMHIRMNGPKKLVAGIKAHEGSMIELTGIMKKGQYDPGGANLGGGFHVGGGAPVAGGGPGGMGMGSPGGGQVQIDVEGWRQIGGDCPAR